jgi:hypothetical protein
MRVNSDTGQFLYDSHMAHSVPSSTLFMSGSIWAAKNRADLLKRGAERLIEAVSHKIPHAISHGSIPKTDDNKYIYRIKVAWIDSGLRSSDCLRPIGELRMIEGSNTVSYHQWYSESLSGVLGGDARKEPTFTFQYGSFEHMVEVLRQAFNIPVWEMKDKEVRTAHYVAEATVTDPDSHLPVDVSIYKLQQGGGMFGVDSSYLAQELDDDDTVTEPFDGDSVILIDD